MGELILLLALPLGIGLGVSWGFARLRWTRVLHVLLARTAWVERQITPSVGLDGIGAVLMALVGVVAASELAVGGTVWRW